MPSFLWGYFLTREKLVTIYKEKGGQIGHFNPDDFDDVQHARRAIAHYLKPATLVVFYADLDDIDGMIFFVGKPDRGDLRRAVDLGLAKRCLYLFDGPPDPCEVVEDTEGYVWELTRGEKTHTLTLLEFMQSTRKGDRYPLTIDYVPVEQRHLFEGYTLFKYT